MARRLRPIRVQAHSENGQAIVEFALVLPILMAILLGIIQFGIVFNNYITLTDATRAGARKAAVSRFLNDNGASAKQAVQDSATGLNLSVLTPTISVTSSPDWNTPGGVVTVSASYPYNLNILGWTVVSGNLNSTTHERLE